MRSCGEMEARGGLKPLSVANRVRVQVPPGALSLRTRTWNMDTAKDRGFEGSSPSEGIRPCNRTGICTAFRVRVLRVQLPPWSLRGSAATGRRACLKNRYSGGSTPLSLTYRNNMTLQKRGQNNDRNRYGSDRKKHSQHIPPKRNDKDKSGHSHRRHADSRRQMVQRRQHADD